MGYNPVLVSLGMMSSWTAHLHFSGGLGWVAKFSEALQVGGRGAPASRPGLNTPPIFGDQMSVYIVYRGRT